MFSFLRRITAIEKQTNTTEQGVWIILDDPKAEDKPSAEDMARLMDEQRRKHPGIMVLVYVRDAAGVWQLAE